MNSWFPRRNPDNREGEIISLEPIVGLRPIAAHKLERSDHFKMIRRYDCVWAAGRMPALWFRV
jgi:hypothetical protein